MSLEQAIHDHWAGGAALIALLPADRFRTGWMAPPAGAGMPALPYVALEHRGELASMRTSGSGELTEAIVRFHVWAVNLAAAKQIAAEIETRFARQHFATTDLTVQDMKRLDHRELPQPDATWHLQLDYLARTERT